MKGVDIHVVRRLLPQDVSALAHLLHGCVHGGASVGFIMPFGIDDAEEFWTGTIAPRVNAGDALLFLARADEAVVGTVQLGLAMPANQPHRADVAKLLVDPAWRRQGIAKALMAALEAGARSAAKSLLTLDTRTGDDAEPLYGSLGFTTVGVIPGYCLDPFSGALDGTTLMFKNLEAHRDDQTK
ncbi:MAG: GNAT family N-acetyltransferase [Pseudomonadota bacterium]